MNCPKCGFKAYSRKIKTPEWRCRKCAHEWDSPLLGRLARRIVPSGFIGSIVHTIKNSWRLYKACWSVLIHDKELMLFPLSAILSFFAVMIVGVVIVFSFLTNAPNAVYFALLGVAYYLTFFIFIYFEAAVIGSARIRFNGGDPTLSDGFHASNSNLKRLFLWSVVSCTVSLFINLLGRLARRIGRKFGLVGLIVSIIIMAIIRGAWTFKTYLVVPVIVYEQVYPVTAMKRFNALLQHTWGEIIVGEYGFGIACVLLTIPLILINVLIGSIAGGLFGTAVGLSVCFVTFVATIGLLAIITCTLRSIYLAALYEYAITGLVPSVFASDSQIVTHGWVPVRPEQWNVPEVELAARMGRIVQRYKRKFLNRYSRSILERIRRL